MTAIHLLKIWTTVRPIVQAIGRGGRGWLMWRKTGRGFNLRLRYNPCYPTSFIHAPTRPPFPCRNGAVSRKSLARRGSSLFRPLSICIHGKYLVSIARNRTQLQSANAQTDVFKRKTNPLPPLTTICIYECDSSPRGSVAEVPQPRPSISN